MVLAFNLIIPVRLQAQAPEWLSEVAVTSGHDSPNEDSIAPSVHFGSPNELEAFRHRVLSEWSSFLGALEKHTQLSNASIRVHEKVEQEPGLLRIRISYETEPEQWTEAFILRPQTEPADMSLPGVVVFHSTVDNSIYQPVGVAGPDDPEPAKQDELNKAFALHLARRGYVTLSPRNYLWPSNIGIKAKEEAESFNSRNPIRKGMARMLLDSLLAVDVLISQPGVDPKRIGAIGHSLGAKEVLYLAAFDDRIQAAVSSEGGLGIRQSNWEAPWYLSTDCLKPDFKLDHHQLLATVAPRPFLLIGGNASDGIDSLPYLQQARLAYTISGAPSHLGFYNHGQGHAVTPQSLERSLQWLDWNLKR